MKKRQLVYILIVPFLMICMSIVMRWYEHRLISENTQTRENIQKLKGFALYPGKEANPQERIKILSKSLIGVVEASNQMRDGLLEVFQGLRGVLEGLAILQILFAIQIFYQTKLPKGGS